MADTSSVPIYGRGDEARLDRMVNDQGLDQLSASRILWGSPQPEPKPPGWTPPRPSTAPTRELAQRPPLGRWRFTDVIRRLTGGGPR